MLINNFKTVVFYVPVQQKYLSRWEYYCVDQRMLEATFDEVIIAINFWQFLQAVISKKPDLVYFWWMISDDEESEACFIHNNFTV